jgi:hypothetical protein
VRPVGKLATLVIRFSVLDLSPINQGSDAAHAFHNSPDLAQRAEMLRSHEIAAEMRRSVATARNATSMA